MRQKIIFLFILSALVCQVRGTDPIWLDDMDLNLMEVEFGQNVKNKTSYETPLTIGGEAYTRGISTMPVSKYLIELSGNGERFLAKVGIDDESGDNAEAEFIVLGDKEILWRSGILKKGGKAKDVDINLKGINRLALLVTRGTQKNGGGPGFPGGGFPAPGGPGPGAGPGPGLSQPGGPPFGAAPGDKGPGDRKFMPRMTVADWAEAKIEYTGTEIPKAIENKAESAQGEILTPPAPKSPRINGAKIIGATPGKPFLFAIPVSGIKPIQISVKGLPKTLSLDPVTGIIKGTAPEKGTYVVEINAVNGYGKTSGKIRIISGDVIALTPPMGWNSWNAWGTRVDEEKVKAAANVFAEKLRDYGWTYINIDDGWEASERTSEGELLGNEKFPDMKRVADYVHSLGLKFGIYSSPGPKTCGGNLASYGYEIQDAETWAEWGVDYLKYDWCSYGNIAKDQSAEELQKPYRIMRSALDQTDRDIVYGLCQYGMGDVWTWGADVGANLWRTSGDIQDSWSSLKKTGFSQTGCADYAKPGHWNDPDMLVIGEVGGWGSNIHYTKLTPDEQYSHISLWCLMSSPMLIGCNLNKLDDFTLNLITNNEVISVNQDPLGKQAKPLITTDQYQIWGKDMEDGSKVFGIFYTGTDSENPEDLFNWGKLSEKKSLGITLPLSDLGLTGKYSIRDLWRQKDLGIFSGTFATEVNYHGVILVKVTKI